MLSLREMFIVLPPSLFPALPDREGKEIKTNVMLQMEHQGPPLLLGMFQKMVLTFFPAPARSRGNQNTGDGGSVSGRSAVCIQRALVWSPGQARARSGARTGNSPEAMPILPLRGLAKRGRPQDFKVTSRRLPTGGGACMVGTDKGIRWE